MSSYMVLTATSRMLRRILWEAFDADPVIRPIVGSSEDAIVLLNPTETARNLSNRLSLWLYHVSENEFTKNAAPVRANGHDSRQAPPLALNLFYLITPFAPTGEGDQMLLGKAMQVLYDDAILLLQNPGDQIAEDLRLVLCRLSLEELSRIWDALREPYRLSVCYQVHVVHIDSQRTTSAARVVEQTTGAREKALEETE